MFGIVRFGLEQMSSLSKGCKNVRVKEISLINGGDTLLCEFYPENHLAIDIKGEMSSIMGFLDGLWKDDLFDHFNIRLFALKAVNDDGEELMYVISSKAAAAAIGVGQSIEWIRTSWFVENTSDYRLSLAKGIISEIENGIRLAITEIYKAKYGNLWWAQAIDPNISKSIENTYLNQFGATTDDGNILIKYTFILDLKKIIAGDWGSFRHLFGKMVDFEKNIVELNIIRREEAHNREITRLHIVQLEELHSKLLSEILVLYPRMESSVLIENWRSKIKKTMINPFSAIYTMDEFNALKTLEEKRQLIIQDCNAQIEYLERINLQLAPFKAPVSKMKKHEKMLWHITELIRLTKRKLNCTIEQDWEVVESVISDITAHHKSMDEFSKQFLIEESS